MTRRGGFIGMMLLRLVGMFVITGISGCASRPPWNLAEPPTSMPDTRPVAEAPEEVDPSLYWDAVNQSTFYLLENSLDLPRQYRKLFGRHREAHDVDALGRVPNSSWFTNRMGKVPMTPEEIRRGPQTIDGPEPVGPWTIIRAKTQGVTPGFFSATRPVRFLS